MGFTIPNAAAATIIDQSEPDSVDFQALGDRTSGVISGCEVTAPGSTQTVNVAAGEVLSNGTFLTVSSTSLDLGAGDASSPRFDLVVVSSAGTVTKRQGTAGANATFPALTSGDVLLAAVYRGSGTGDNVDSTRVIDKRIITPSAIVRTGTGTPGSGVGSTGDIYINTAVSSNTGQSQIWVKSDAGWENLAEYVYPIASANTASTIVARDASGNFSAGTITATLTGTASSATLATKASTLSRGGGTGAAMTFYGSTSGSGTPVLLGSTDSTNWYTYAPSTLSVNYATTAGSANSVLWTNVSGRPGYTTVSTSTPTGGSNGDVWIQVV